MQSQRLTHSLTRMWGMAMVLAAALVAQSQEPTLQDRPASATSQRIAFYEQQVAQHPRHYPAYARLGRAWLDRARETYDPAAVAEARTALQRSLEIQANYEALYDSAAVANFSHRFEEALTWSQQAAEAMPEDRRVIALRVESLLALDRLDEARAAIGSIGGVAQDFGTAAALGQWYLSHEQRKEAVAEFLIAARLAREQKAKPLAVWAMVTAAGVWIDAGNLPLARPLFEAAAQLDPEDRYLKIHAAELAAAEGNPEEALRIYEEILTDQPDPELHRRAYVLAKQLERNTAADFHLDAADQLCRRVIDAGEIFSLETLANLYCDAGRVTEAVRYAEQNMQYKRDAAARETLARARRPNDSQPQ